MEHYAGKLPNFARFLRAWGEAGTVKTGKDGKVGDCEVTMIFVGHVNEHE